VNTDIGELKPYLRRKRKVLSGL